MTVYGDTSWWIACKITDDANHHTAVQVFDLFPGIQVIWTPWQRAEVFNSLRQLERAGLINVGKAREFLIRLLEQEVRLGYWPHTEFDWRDAVRTAYELSAEHGLSVPIRGDSAPGGAGRDASWRTSAVRDEFQNVSATLCKRRNYSSRSFPARRETGPVLSPMKPARPAEAVPRALKRFGKAEVFEHLEHGDGSLTLGRAISNQPNRTGPSAV